MGMMGEGGWGGGVEENGIRKISQKTYFWSVVEESCVGAVAGCEYMSDELVQRVREEEFYNYFSIFIKKFRVFFAMPIVL